MSKQPIPPPPGDKPVPSAPPPPPAWRHWLWPGALLVMVVLYLFLPGIHLTQPVSLHYSQFISDANAHKVKDVTFGSGTNGSNTTVTGTLTSGKDFTTVIPGQPTPQLSAQLTADGVKSVTAAPPTSSLGSELLYFAVVVFLPLAVVFYLFRRMSRGAAGGLQGVLGVGKSKAKVFDEERPQTKFSDVAGYTGAKKEIAEVVDFLKNPERYRRGGAPAAPRPAGVVPPRPAQHHPGHVAAARDRILLGRREDSNVLLPEEKYAVAVHESGHALVAVLSEHADPVAKVTILPAGQALGVTEQLPLVERHLYGEDYLKQSLAVRLGGRSAELVELGQGSTGAANDLASATDLATRMVREFGLSDALGPVGYPEGGSVFLGGGGSGLSSRPFAEATQAIIDTEVSRLLREAEETAVSLIRTHRTELTALTNLLLEKETVDGEEVYALVGVPMPENRQDAHAIAPVRATAPVDGLAHRADAEAAILRTEG